MRRLIITGGEGFVGRHLQAEIVKNCPNAEVFSWDLPAVDLTKPDTYRQKLAQINPDWVVHLAAFTATSQSFTNREKIFAINVAGTQNLLQAIADYVPQAKILVASSADIYGKQDSGSLSELELRQCHPRNPYAASKLAMEETIERQFNDRVIRVRPFPHIGPGQKKGFVTADFAAQIAAIEQGSQEPVIQVGNLSAARDFTDVRDVVRAYRLLLELGQLGEVYNIASGQAVSIQAILDQLLAMSVTKITTAQDVTRLRQSDTAIITGDASKLRTLTAWQPQIPLSQTLHDILDYWRTE